jgi:Spy/CpxP family protein refolding chaperone
MGGHGIFAGHSFCAGDTDKHIARAVGWLVDDVKGTPDQEQKLTAIAKSAAADLCILKTQAQENHLQAAAILTKDTVDRAALETVRARQMELANTASTRLTRAIADAADVLTPAQRVALAEALKKRHG